MFPAAWADFTAPINQSLGSINDVLTAYAELLHAEDEFTRLQAARAWNLWEYRLSVADSQATQDRKTRPSNELSNAQIEHHYLSQYCFFDPKLFDRPNAELDAIPIYLLHGANDYVCPLGNATHLKALFPQIKLEILEDAGHCAFSPKMAEGLCGATRRLAGLYGH
jgi:proline iminopeptidase